MSVYKKLMQARVRLQQTKLSKSGENKFAKYKYFELADFLPTAQAIFAELGLCGIVSYRHETATLSIRDTDGDGEIIITSPMSTAALKGCHEVQNLGAVQTYLRRYLWVTALEIVEHDALDSAPPKDAAPKHRAIPEDAMASLPEGVQEVLRDLAMEVVDLVRNGQPSQAADRLKAEGLDSDQKIGLWSILDSKTRSAIKTAEKSPQLDRTEKEPA